MKMFTPKEENKDEEIAKGQTFYMQMRDPKLAKMAMYERKSTLVDAQFRNMGMGRYQWQIWTLCGLGYMLDLMWAQAFGLIASPMQQELGFDNTRLGNIFTAFSAGLCAGAIFWGVVGDIVGRKWAFNLTVLFTAAFGFAIAAPDSYDAVLALVVFNGFGIGGNVPIDTTISLEYLPTNRRYLLAMLSLFQPVGVVISCAIAYGLVPADNCLNGRDIPSCLAQENLRPPECLPACNNVAAGEDCCRKADNMGWRYVVITLGAVSVFVLVLRCFIFRFRESPKYLLSKGRDQEALECVEFVCRVNKKKCKLTIEDFENCEKFWTRREGMEDFGFAPGTGTDEFGRRSAGHNPNPPSVEASRLPRGGFLHKATAFEKIRHELKRYNVLFSDLPMIRLTVGVWIVYAFDFWGFSIAGNFLPTILLRKNADLDVSLTDTYRDYIIIYAPGILGVALGGYCGYDKRIGRQYLMIVAASLMAIMLFLFAVVNDRVSNIVLNCLEYFFQSAFNAVLYGWTPEAFPAVVRGTASGVASFWGRLFSIVAPIAASKLLDTNINGPLYLAGAGVCVAVVTLMTIPRRFFAEEYLKSH